MFVVEIIKAFIFKYECVLISKSIFNFLNYFMI